MVMEADPPVLSLGIILGGNGAVSKACREAIAGVELRIIAERDGVDSPIRVNVVFHLRSPGDPNGFVGSRTRRFDKKSSHLMVQVAVPDGLVESRPEMVMVMLRQAIDEVEKWMRKWNLGDGLTGIRCLVDRL
jgi:hypothetical protein